LEELLNIFAIAAAAGLLPLRQLHRMKAIIVSAILQEQVLPLQVQRFSTIVIVPMSVTVKVEPSLWKIVTVIAIFVN
jgi:hypothetical protein